MATSFNERFDQHGTWRRVMPASAGCSISALRTGIGRVVQVRRRELTEQKLVALTQYLLPMTTPDGFGVVMNVQSD